MLYCAQWWTSESMLRSTWREPIKVSLARKVKNTNQNHTMDLVASPTGRTKELLFRRVLGIREGQEFIFNFDKWQALQSCGLFTNLTARTVELNNTVQLIITGVERESLVFAPEVSLDSTFSNPEISGGVSNNHISN